MRDPRWLSPATGCALGLLTLTLLATGNAHGAEGTLPAQPSTSKPAEDDGWPDLSSFLDKKFGFLPVVMPITEPAVGYGAAGGLVFLSKSLGDAAKGLGRPNITFVGGMGTANGSWGAVGADIRYWLEDHVQTLVGGIYASINLDFYGIGSDSRLENHPLRYNLNPKAGTLQGKYRFGESQIWLGFGYAFALSEVRFDVPDGTAELPDYERLSNVGVILPSLKLDTRDNVFTPLRGVFAEASVGIAGKWLGGDDNFVRAGLTVIQYLPLPHDFYFGLRLDGSAAFGNAPFYVLPYVGLRGVPVMRYQGEEVLSLEGELRWQFWKRWSILGFAGAGNAWNDFEKLDDAQGVVSGGGGFRYELARSYGIHMGVDIAFSRDTTAFYVQAGSAWGRP